MSAKRLAPVLLVNRKYIDTIEYKIMPTHKTPIQSTRVPKTTKTIIESKIVNKANMVFRVFPTDSSNFSFIKFLLRFIYANSRSIIYFMSIKIPKK